MTWGLGCSTRQLRQDHFPHSSCRLHGRRDMKQREKQQCLTNKKYRYLMQVVILSKFYLNKGHFKNQSFPQSWLFSVLCAIGNDGGATLLKRKARGRRDCTPSSLDEHDGGATRNARKRRTLPKGRSTVYTHGPTGSDNVCWDTSVGRQNLKLQSFLTPTPQPGSPQRVLSPHWL